MKTEDALADCEAAVRRYDPDRYFASLFAPADKRSLLFALYAFNHEIARAAEVANEPFMAQIRLQWWREAIEEALVGRPRAQPAAMGLAELVGRGRVAVAALEAMIDAREEEISAAPFVELAALEQHVAATSGALMRIAAGLLDCEVEADPLARKAGTAFGLAGILRSIPFHAARGKSFLPTDLLAAEGEEATTSRVARAADNHFKQARGMSIPKTIVPAILPAALVPAYLSRVVRQGGDISPLRRQLILLRAATIGRL